MSKRYGGSDYVIALLILLVFGPIVYGYALSVMWGWFIVPTFELPALSIPLAVGVAMTVRMITNQAEPQRKEDDDNPIVKALAHAVVAPLFTLAFAWIVSSFV